MSSAEPLQEKDIIYGDNHLIIVNKKPGEIVQGDNTGDLPLVDKVKDYLRERYNKPGNVFAGLIHRLDRPVSGAVAFARTSKALARMNQMIKERQVTKTYWALVEGKINEPEDTLAHYLKKNPRINKSFVVDENEKDAHLAQLQYRLRAVSNRYSLLEVNLITGRHHQIRAQLAAIGHPIKGDVKYGFKRLNKNGKMIHLHARAMQFVHPVRKENITVVAQPPNEKLWDVFDGIINSTR